MNRAFPQAARPVAANTLITTDTAGIISGEVGIPVEDGRVMPSWRSAPDSGANFPMILVVQEIFGVHDHIQDITRRLAKLGYLAIAPELYFRQGDPSQVESIDQLRSNIVSKVPDAQVLNDLDTTLAWAESHGGDAGRLGITGFCWGGRITWLYAAHQDRIKAAVAWYGRLLGEHNLLQPSHPVDVIPQLKAPVLGLYGGKDEGIPLPTIEAFRAALNMVGSSSFVHVYPDAPHAFYADYRPSYRKDAAKDGWRRMLDWFKQHGVA